MKYDFDEIIERRGTSSVKWDAAREEGVLPMWVADMDFKTAPCVVSALRRRAEHGVFGYGKAPDEFYGAIADWFLRRHGVVWKREWILHSAGVVPALSAIIRALAGPGDRVVVQEPVYHCFFSSIKNNGCEVSSSNLRLENGRYEMDFADLEEKLSDPMAKVFLLCSPHNPSGRVWTRAELERAGELCLKHGVTVVSDEIHCDIVFGPARHVPFSSLGERFLQGSVTCASPSKTFNLAGLNVSNIIVADESLRKRIGRALNANEVSEIGPFAMDAQIAAYGGGEEWLEELKKYLRVNFDFLDGYLRENLPGLSAMPLEATYLPWIDCSALGIPSAELARLLYEKGRLWLNPGSMYGAGGEGFVRMNIACARATLADGLDRMKRALS